MARGSSLLAYVVTRILLAIPMLFILLTAVFIVLRILPGDPVLALWGQNPPPAAVEAARQQLGLDQPPIVQYFTYLRNIFTGNLGTSIGELYRGQPVWNQISVRFPATVELVFGVWLQWLPPNGRWTGTDVPCTPPSSCPIRTGLYTVDSLIEGNLAHFVNAVSHLILPSITLGLVLSGFFAKTVRANMLRTIGADFTEAARARGVRKQAIVYRHAFKNALVPVVTVLGLQFAILFAGAILTEKTFSIQGLGILLLNSVTSKDMTMIQGVVVFYATIIIVIALLAPVIAPWDPYAFVDERDVPPWTNAPILANSTYFSFAPSNWTDMTFGQSTNSSRWISPLSARGIWRA